MHSPTCCIVVDDDADFLLFARRCLLQMKLEFDVITFSSGRDALEFLNRIRAALIITDLQMPLMAGAQLAAEVRRFDSVVPIIGMSAQFDQEQALAAGADVFIEKQSFVEQLTAALKRTDLRRRMLGASHSSSAETADAEEFDDFSSRVISFGCDYHGICMRPSL